MNYYNEFDHNAAEWLRQLIGEGLIPKGDVDERSIADVRATELVGYTQCHFFAGISGWPLALQLAGWPEDKPVWTGSCPCQPFSTAGKRKGFSDERDLWPVFSNLIKEGKPEVVFGEQVASSEVVGSVLEADFIDAVRKGDFARANRIAHQLSRSSSLHYYHRWLDRVRSDMDAEGYAVRGEVLGAHSVGAPHRRYRLYWGGRYMGDADREQAGGAEPGQSMPCEGLPSGGVADGGLLGQAKRQEQTARGKQYCEIDSSPVADNNSKRSDREPVSTLSGRNDCAEVAGGGIASLPPWSSSRFIYCRDNKIRRVPAESVFLGVADGVSDGVDGIRVEGICETGGFPLTTQKVGRSPLLKGYGNAINPYCAKEFIVAFMEDINGMSI